MIFSTKVLVLVVPMVPLEPVVYVARVVEKADASGVVVETSTYNVVPE